jgi:hypothetical protein
VLETAAACFPPPRVLSANWLLPHLLQKVSLAATAAVSQVWDQLQQGGAQRDGRGAQHGIRAGNFPLVAVRATGVRPQRHCSGSTSGALPQQPAQQRSTTTFSHLPNELQSLIFAYSQAPFHTCKTSAAVLQDTQDTQGTLAVWLKNVHYPATILRKAAQCKQWRVCSLLLLRLQSGQAVYELSWALQHAAADGQLELVKSLLDKGAELEVPPRQDMGDLSPETYMRYVSHGFIPDPYQHRSYRTTTGMAAARTQAHSGGQPTPDHALVLAARNGHVDVCRLLLQQRQITVHILRRALCAAAAGGYLEVMQLLVGHNLAVSTAGVGPAPLFAGTHAVS